MATFTHPTLLYGATQTQERRVTHASSPARSRGAPAEDPAAPPHVIATAAAIRTAAIARNPRQAGRGSRGSRRYPSPVSAPHTRAPVAGAVITRQPRVASRRCGLPPSPSPSASKAGGPGPVSKQATCRVASGTHDVDGGSGRFPFFFCRPKRA